MANNLPPLNIPGLLSGPDVIAASEENKPFHERTPVKREEVIQVPGQPFDFTKVHVHIGLPCYGGQMQANTMTSLISFFLIANQIGLKWSLDTMQNESLVQRARSTLCAKMMHNQEATHFFFLDADIAFDPESIIKLIVSDKDIIAGCYPKKTLPINYNVNLEKQTKLQGDLYTVATAATGFLMFKRKVYEDLCRAYPEEKFVDDIGLGKKYEPYLYNIFACYVEKEIDIAKGHLLSEDWAFCFRAKKLGYDIWMDSSIKLDHIGNFVYSGDPSKLKIQPQVKK